MKIRNHKLVEAVQAYSPNQSGTINPKFIVMHYTAGWSAKSAINTFKNPKSRVSAQVTISKNGTIYQHVDFNKKAWHAGPSKFGGYSGLNSHSIGIEIVNPGWLRKVTGGYQDSYGKFHTEKSVGRVVAAKNARVGGGTFYWPLYTEAALDATEELTELLIAEYGIIDIVTHEEIDTRGWKTDAGPAFPMNRYRKLLNHRDADEDEYIVTAGTLNVRSGPGSNYGVLSELRRGTRISVLDTSGSWAKISDDGWVHSGYLRRV